MTIFQGRVGILQRVLASYRAPFFDGLAAQCSKGLQIFAGEPMSHESIRTCQSLHVAKYVPAQNRHFNIRGSYFCWQSGLIHWVRNWQPDVLIVEANPRYFSTHFAIRLMKIHQRPVIGWGLGSLDWSASDWVLFLRHQALRHFYGTFDALIAYSSKGATDYKRAGVSPERIFVAHNAVSNEDAEKLFFMELNQTPRLIEAWHREIGIAGNNIVLYVGRLLPPKRVDCLIKACAMLDLPCQLLIVGDGPERTYLESLARQVLPSARFLGERTGRELAMCFAGANLFVLPGTGGLAVQEAMIYGKPVIVAAGDGTQSDLVREGKNGFIVPQGDEAILAESIRYCIEDSARLQRMGNESRRIVTDEVNLNRMIETFVQALNFVMRQSDKS